MFRAGSTRKAAASQTSRRSCTMAARHDASISTPCRVFHVARVGCRSARRRAAGDVGSGERHADRSRRHQGRTFHAQRAAHRLHGHRRRWRRGRRRIAARRRAGHARNRSAQSAEHGRQGERGRPRRRQRVRTRGGHRYRAMARGAQHRLGCPHRESADRARGDPVRPAGRRESKNSTDRRLRLQSGRRREHRASFQKAALVPVLARRWASLAASASTKVIRQASAVR